MSDTQISVGKGTERRLPEMLDHLLEAAMQQGATDLHIDPVEREFLVRFRIDGVVHENQRLSVAEGHRLINQIKVAAEMEIERVQAPLEGQFHWHEDGHVRDVRVTVIPTFHTEAAHLRLLRMPEQWHDIVRLGFSESAREQVQHALSQPGGLVLVAGLAGAGKTTTLYALASQHDLGDRIAASIEDPIEFNLPFVRQLRVDERRGVTMSDALATMLRMDPDILMVGEVRDRESAVTVAHAALAGRLVLATVHAPDAATAIEAMHYQSVPYYILGSTLRLVIAQSLVRRVCPECAERRPLRADETTLFEAVGVRPPEQVCEPRGCELCHGYGYRGRVGVYQVVVVDRAMSDWLTQGKHAQDIRHYLAEHGVRSLVAEALQKAADGITSMPEVFRLRDGHGATVAVPGAAADTWRSRNGPEVGSIE